jgi:pimeloyl-ACP methyl ester carboxylesterase
MAAAILALSMAAGCLTPAARVASPAQMLRDAADGSGEDNGDTNAKDKGDNDDDGISYVDVGDAFLRVRDRGPRDSAKATLVLVHGFGARLDNWRAVQDALATDRRVVAFDQKGFGKSERSDGDYGPDKHGRDVLTIMDALHIDRAVLGGHSYGGGVIMRTALLAPDRVRGVALVDALILEGQMPTSFRWARIPVVGEAIFSVLFSELPGEKYVMAFHDGQRFASAKVLDEVHLMQSQPGSTFAQLRTVRAMHYGDVEGGYRAALGDVPRVVIWGEKDRVTPLRFGKVVAAAIDAPLVVLPATGHVPLIERPTLVTHAIRDVLLQADESTSPAPKKTPPLTREPMTPPSRADDDDDDDDDDNDGAPADTANQPGGRR